MDELTVLVTGSSRGIGRAAAIRLAREGYTVVVHGRTMSDALKATLSEVQALSPASRALTFDVSDREAARAAVSEDVEAHGAYYGLVLNAGINADGTFAAMPAEDWDRVIAVDLGSFYNVVQPLVMPMVHRRKPGRIVVMSSVAGVIGNRGQVNYSAAKAGLIGAVKALALELASRAITVNAVAPGLIETEMVTEEILERVKPFIPMRRAGKPEEVAGASTPYGAFWCRKATSRGSSCRPETAENPSSTGFRASCPSSGLTPTQSSLFSITGARPFPPDSGASGN